MQNYSVENKKMCGSRHIRTNLTLFCSVRTKKPRTVRGFEMNCK